MTFRENLKTKSMKQTKNGYKDIRKALDRREEILQRITEKSKYGKKEKNTLRTPTKPLTSHTLKGRQGLRM